MKPFIHFLFLCFPILALPLAAQQQPPQLKSAATFAKTYYEGSSRFAQHNAAFVFYNEGKHELQITIDFSMMKVGVDSLDEWLKDLESTRLVFKGILNTDNLLTLTHNNAKLLQVNGKIKFNGVIDEHMVELVLYEISKEGILFESNQSDYYDRLRANIQLSFLPREFKLDKLPHHLRKPITININKAYLNQAIPEFQAWIDNSF